MKTDRNITIPYMVKSSQPIVNKTDRRCPQNFVSFARAKNNSSLSYRVSHTTVLNFFQFHSRAGSVVLVSLSNRNDLTVRQPSSLWN